MTHTVMEVAWDKWRTQRTLLDRKQQKMVRVSQRRRRASSESLVEVTSYSIMTYLHWKTMTQVVKEGLRKTCYLYIKKTHKEGRIACEIPLSISNESLWWYTCLLHRFVRDNSHT